MKNFKSSILILLAISIVSCTKDAENETFQETPITQQGVSPEILSKLESRGFDINLSPVIATKGGYFVEGDIFITNKSIEGDYAQKQRYFGIVNCARAGNIRIQNRLGDNEVGKGFDRALRLWNNVNGGSTLKLISVRSNPDILVRLARSGEIGTNLGIGELPTDGVEGGLIRLNDRQRVAGKKLTTKQWSIVIAHEIGHNIGFLHTDTSGDTTQHIPGTPDIDNQEIDELSIMTAGGVPEILNISLNVPGLSKFDKISVRRMYSKNANRLCN